MDLKRFGQLMQESPPGQRPAEWRAFIEFIETYFKNRGIENPIVVELGIGKNYQKLFYGEFLNAEHTGIDVVNHLYWDPAVPTEPDILGDTHDAATLIKLKEKLGGKKINLLFIDADHGYDSVKKDLETYGPLVKNIIAFHDIMTLEHSVRLLWWEGLFPDKSDWLKLVFYQYSSGKYQYGIGCLVKA